MQRVCVTAMPANPTVTDAILMFASSGDAVRAKHQNGTINGVGPDFAVSGAMHTIFPSAELKPRRGMRCGDAA